MKVTFTKNNKFFYKFIIIILVLSLGFASFFTYFRGNAFSSANINANNKKSPTIVIDAGHGGFDGGATAGEVTEKDINLDIALKLQRYFVMNGFHVIMIRDNDTSVADKSGEQKTTKKKTDMYYRLETMHENENTVFISIHQNKFPSDTSCRGTQVFFSENNTQSKAIADGVQNSVKELVQPENKRVTVKAKSNLFLLYKAKVPAILVECGFLSNPTELYNLQNQGYQQELAFAIFSGAVSQFDKLEDNTLNKDNFKEETSPNNTSE